MNLEELTLLEKGILSLILGTTVVLAGHKLALELWCVAYGFGMQLGLL